MSPHFSWQSAVLKSGCESTTKYVLLVVGTYMNQHGDGAFPSYSTIAESASMHRATVIKHLGLAEKAGWLCIKRRFDKDGEAESNLYGISFPDKEVVVQNDHLVVQNDQGGRPQRLGVVVQNDPNTPSITPQVSPHKNKVASLPSWLPQESWEGFVEMRKTIRKPMTARAVTMILKKLEGFLQAGQDVAAVLDQSVVKSWQDVFPVRQPIEQKADKPREAPWWSSNESMLKKGREIGMQPRSGESWQDFRGRIDVKLGGMTA